MRQLIKEGVDYKMLKPEDLTFPKIKEKINKAGNLFYQYRACRRDAATVYDIENIRHGVVYARTPLQMNDPFDSMVGFSPEKIYDECIDLVLDQAEEPLDENIRLILKSLLKYRLIGKTIEFMDALNKLKKYIFIQSVIEHVPVVNIPLFIMKNMEKLYKRSPADVKKYFDKSTFMIFSIFIKDYKNVDIDEKTLVDALNMEEALSALEKATVEVRDKKYIPFIQDFLSKLTVVCFSASGWDNQLMWSHYANSYSGICVEYDFEKMNKFIGFMYPVEYCDQRPTLTLKDLGLTKFTTDENGQLKTEEVDMSAIFSYMLAKNKCWAYEEEWRIINTGDTPYTPIFIDTPFVKSITLGLNVDELCKHLIMDICQEKGIECYQLSLNSRDYALAREKLTSEDFFFDEEKELEYIKFLSEHTAILSQKCSENSKIVIEGIEKEKLEVNAMLNMLTSIQDFLSDAYFLKSSFNRYCRNKGIQTADIQEDPQIVTAIAQIDSFISQAKEGADSINESSVKLLLAGKISTQNFQTVKSLTADILELVAKHDSLKWYFREMKEENIT